MTTYLNYEVLDGTVRPDHANGIKHTNSASLAIVASSVGTRRVFDRRGVPVLSRSISVIAAGAMQVKALRAFIAARRGRVVPFWLTTGQADAIAALPAAAGATSIAIKSTGYAGVFAAGNARRHLVINGQYVKALSVVANGNGTDTVQLASQLQAPLRADDVISCLVLCRLGADAVSLNFDHQTVATADFDAVELPKEAP